jgi:hypothetical protein
MYCQDYWGAGICIPNRRDSGYCDIECEDGFECRFDYCVESDPNGSTCEFDDACFPTEFCISGHCTVLDCTPGETQSCYYGTPGTAGVGECRSGYHLCTEEGVFTSECIGEVLTAPDEGFLACNGQDNNCDGINDEGDTENIDIVFGFDISGSMAEELLAVSEAIRRLSVLYNYSTIRLGLVLFPDPTEDWLTEHIPRTMIPLSSYSDFAFQLGFLGWVSTSSGGKEASWDLPVLLSNDLLEGIDFRPDAKRVLIMFTDERGQTYYEPADLGLTEENNEQHMCEAVRDSGLLLYVVTAVGDTYSNYDRETGTTYGIIEEDYDECGRIFSLSEDPQDMVDNLSDIADLVCTEE